MEASIEELIQQNYLVGAQSYLTLSTSMVEKKLVNGNKKRKVKEEAKREVAAVQQQSDDEFPIRINFVKLLSEERRRCVLDFSQSKLEGGSEIDFKLLQFLIKRQANITNEVLLPSAGP